MEPLKLHSPGTDAAAQASAAFAACGALYSNRTLSSSASILNDTDYASTLKTHAQELYAFATNASAGMRVYQESVPQSADAYASSDYHDELAIAALFLALLEGGSNATAYYADVVKWYYSSGLGAQLQAGSEAVFNWDSKTPGIPLLGAQIAHTYPDVVSGSNATLQVWQSALESYFNVFISMDGARSFLTDGQSLDFVSRSAG